MTVPVFPVFFIARARAPFFAVFVLAIVLPLGFRVARPTSAFLLQIFASVPVPVF